MSIPNLKMNTGNSIPQVGLGLWQIKNEADCVRVIHEALQAGYRHLDTAQIYGNEEFVGKAVAESDIPRKDIFITTKINVANFGHRRTLKSFDNSLQKLQTDYVDLLLLHFPVTLLRSKSWKALEEIKTAGKAKAIGVSNYTIRHLEQLLEDCKIKPAVNQVELHVFLQQPELVNYCQEHNIVVEAYSPLAHGQGLDDPTIGKLAKKYHKTSGQIMLRWCIERGMVPLPKSVHKDRIEQNITLFDFAFDETDKTLLKGLDKNLRTCWDPTRIP